MNFGRHFKKKPKQFLQAIIDMDFFDHHSKTLTLRNTFFTQYKYQLFDSLVFFLTFCFSAWLMFWTFQYKDGQMIMLGRVWSDFAAHIPLIRSFSMGNNFPPEYPTFPGEPIRYHYLFFLIVAGLEKLGLNIALALDTVSALGFWLLLWMIYHTTMTLFRSRKAAILAIVLFLFNGSWSILEIIKKSISFSDFLHRVVSAQEYASFGPWDGHIVSAFWNWNIYLNQRHLAASFAIALAVCYPLLRIVMDRKFVLKKYWYPAIYLSFILFPLFHQAAYVMTVGWCLLWILIFFRKIPKKIIFLYAWAFFFSLLTNFGLTANSKQHPVFDIGYLAQDKTAIGIAYYWLFNLGAYFVLLPIVFLFSNRKVKSFLFPFIGFFGLANVFRLSTDMINNHKLINYALIGGAIVSAGFLMMLWKKHVILKMVVALLLVILTASGVADVFPVINNHFLYQDDYPRSNIQQWIMTHTPQNTVFLSNEYIFNPASIVGRKLFLDYGYFNWSMGYPDGERRQLLKTFYSDTISVADLCQKLEENHISYIHLGNVHGKQEYEIKLSTLFTQFKPQYVGDRDDFIYDIHKNCY
jgi:hypothetical protein